MAFGGLSVGGNNLAAVQSPAFRGGEISTAERRAEFAVERPAVEGRLSLRRIFGEQHQEELVRFFALSARGLEVAAQDAVVLQPLF